MPRRAILQLLAAGALAAACATAPPAPPPPEVAAPAPPPDPPPPAPPPLPRGAAALDEAARLLADGADLPLAARLLEAAGGEDPRRDLLLGQLAELSGDDGAAEAAYGRYLASVDDDEVRLRRALALERLGRGDEVREVLDRLRQPPPPAPPPARRKLRPLLPSAR